ncbi:DUF2017 domain-containing protein [Aeromicrobium sp. IC_218]|uniref:DUF2017 domain-containing protein n=1 Tax=Aeromicrobium sp. IC_218 TaxID=2545468 RepID=UPI00103ABFCC|nr:DUF2017 domain-containing protein [Aeromicrobium sp. IC_218]TCI96034.1 DUF2017 domain-containing protein [Aeromicrobium sp. IC_218]
MKPFRRRRRGRVQATFESAEAHLLANLSAQVVELLRDRSGESESSADPLATQLGMGGPALPPDDPVLRRLLPDAYRDDADDAAEFRRFTEQSLVSSKVANAEVLIETLRAGGLDDGPIADSDDGTEVEVELDPAQVQAWLRALTDVRLALAVRLGIETDEDLERLEQSDDDAVIAFGDVYDWLGFVQESLVVALD